MDGIEQAVAMASDSPVTNYRWKDRGKAPAGYIKGMAAAFLLTLIDIRRTGLASAAVKPLGDASKDVLAWYDDLLPNTASDDAEERLVLLFAIMLGLGMRESSGKHCEGRDLSADNVTAQTAEAGLFQVSFDSIGGHPDLKSLFEAYRGRDDLASIFQEGVRCSDSSWEDWGDGAGREFQSLNKRCPLFAVSYDAVLLRHQRKHWGPINRKEAEVRPDALVMFRAIASLPSL